MSWLLALCMACLLRGIFASQGTDKPVVESNDIDGSSDNIDSHVYIGYSSNPWGTSRRLHEDNSSSSSSSSNASSMAGRSKRGVLHLYNMVLCATGCNPLAYKGYGCYCGFLGSGYTVDGIDRCCKMHDWCYNTANCPMYLEYFVPYTWKCYRRRPLCGCVCLEYNRHFSKISLFEFVRNEKISTIGTIPSIYKEQCTAIDHGFWGGSGSCAQRLCECDRLLAECLRKYSCPRTKAVCTSSPWRLLQNVFML